MGMELGSAHSEEGEGEWVREDGGKGLAALALAFNFAASAPFGGRPLRFGRALVLFWRASLSISGEAEIGRRVERVLRAMVVHDRKT